MIDPVDNTIVQKYEKISHYGLGVTRVLSGLLLKGELYYAQDYPYSNGLLDAIKSAPVSGLSLGVDYNSDAFGSLIVEIQNLRSQNQVVKDQMVDQTLAALSYNKSFFRDQLDIGFFTFAFGSVRNLLARFALGYEFIDSCELTLKYTAIDMGDVNPALDVLEQRDRLDVGINWSLVL